MNKTYFAELSDDRMITDVGPKCPDCEARGACLEHGMWIYLIPSDSDWNIASAARDGNATVQAQCAACHRIESFDVREAHCDNVQRLRARHSDRRDHPHGIYSVTKGGY